MSKRNYAMRLEDLVVSESYFDQGIDMKSTTKALATGVIAAAMLATSVSAHAADEPRFPAIPGAPTWYSAASNAPYASNDATMSDQYVAQEDEQWHASAWWYDPNGGTPGGTEPDIIMETLLRLPGEAGATDPNLIVLSLNAAFPEMTVSLGTEFTNGVVLATGSADASPKLTLPGDGIIIVQRPARDCTVTNDLKDPDRFIVNLALLGENQRRYLTNLTVEFGTRTWNEACAALVGGQNAEETVEPENASKPAQKAEEVKQSNETGAEANGEKVTEVEGDAPASTETEAMSLWGFIGICALLLGATAAIWVAVVVTRRRRSREFENDGTPIDGSTGHLGVDPSRPAVKRSEF
ncbi:hypothetical protein ACFY9N_05725 [Microbacterium sp. NPDC008134]|uniref:hypothetical protein n=1 Tax=Microbacterium sp. NPDC008134 TaxID=3364183 RepID=UPI0036E76C53